MRKRAMGALLAFVAALVLVPTLALAQGTTGTVRGRVADQATGQPLAAVNVVLYDLEGNPTSMGNFTNADGDYVIVNVPPGRYHLRATFVGYTTKEVQNLLVTVGVSTLQNFELEQTVLDVGEVVTVTAERDIIQRDVTATQQSYTIEEMERMAVTTTSDILALQTNVAIQDNYVTDFSGYYDRGFEMVNMRGGRNAQVAFMIDGMQVTNLVFGGQAATVSPFSLSEMVVMASGMSAEFGNAMSGVVNMVTREGGSSYDANAEITTSEFGGEQEKANDQTGLQGYLGGPVPMVPRLTFFMSGSASTARDYVIKKDDIVFDYKADPLDPNWTPKPDIDYVDVPRNEDGSYDWASFDPAEHDIYDQRVNDEAHRPIHGVDVYSGWLGYGFRNNWDGMLNMTYKFTPNMKLNLSGQSNGTWAVPYTDVWRHAMMWGFPDWLENYYVFGYPNYFSGIEDRDAYLRNPYYIDPLTTVGTDGELVNPDADPSNNATGWRIWDSGLTDFQNEKNLLFNNNWRAAFIWTHQLNQSTFYSARGTYYDYNRLMRVFRWENAEGYIPRIEHLYRGIETDPTDPNYGNPVPPTWMFGDDMTSVELRLIPGFGYNEDDEERRRYAYQGWSSSGAGISYDGSDRYISNQYDITRSLKGDITSQVSTHHQVKAGAQYNALTLDMFDCQFPWQTTPSITRYVKHPWEFAAYLQDKVEYDFIIINAGLRYDAANAGPTDYWLGPFNPVHPDTSLTLEERLIVDPRTYYEDTGIRTPTRTGKTYSSVAPRMGISHPVTDQAVIYFNYGHFYQKPIYRNVYRLNAINTGNVITGNPNLELEKTISYEFGYKHQFTDILALEVTLWAKDQSNMVGTQRVPPWYHGVTNPYEYSVAINYDYAHSRGFDLAFQKRYSNFWSARFNYSYMLSEANREYEWEGYHDGSGGYIERQPKRVHTVSWNQPHRFTANFSVQIPEGVGPEIFGVRPIQNTSASVIYRASAGRPYTPSNDEGTPLETNSGQLPWSFQWDLRFYRDFESFGVRYSFFADIRNLLDRRNVISVYSRTGSPTDPGPDATSYTDNYDDFHRYSRPRSINMGLRFYF